MVMMMVDLLLHGTLLDVVRELGGGHSETVRLRMVQLSGWLLWFGRVWMRFERGWKRYDDYLVSSLVSNG